MKILEVNKFYYPKIGGIEKVVQEIAEGIKGSDIFIDVLACSEKGRGEEVVINGVNIIRVSSLITLFGMPISFAFFKKYKKLVNSYDVIFLHYPFPLGFLAYFLFSKNKDLVIWYHSDIIRQKFLEIFFKPFHLYALKRAKKIFVSNPNLIENSNYLRKFKGKCEVIPFGIDLKKFELSEEIKNEIEKIIEKFGKPLILSVGRLVYYKGFQYLIEASKKVDAKFIIIGEGKLKNKLLSLIKKYNLEKKVFIIPPAQSLIAYYYACDLFVLPSTHRSETFGLVLLEAMACGKPVVSTELGTGTSFVNQNGITGIVVPPKDSNALAMAINKIINDNELKEKFGKNALERVKQNFLLEKMLNKLQENLKVINNL